MNDDSPLAHIHCRRCGREMRPASTCASCGAVDLAGLLAAPGLTASPAPPPLPTPVVPASPPVPALTPAPVAVAAASLPRPSRPLHAPALLGRPSPSVHRGPRPRPAPEPTYVEPAPLVPVPAPPPTAYVAALPAAAVEAQVERPVAAPRRKFRLTDLWRRYLPPVRLVWLSLGILIAAAGGFVGNQAAPLLALPIVGVAADLAFQRVRFPRLRFPDAAIATSLFLALIVWPSEISLALLSIAVCSIGLRHLVRVGGHPLLNPAAAGLTLATIMFALPSSWNVGATPLQEGLVGLLGALLIARAPHTWRMPVFYFGAMAIASVVLAVALHARIPIAEVLTVEAFGPTSLFFGLFMVSEPRTAPSARRPMAAFAAVVGLASAIFPVVFAQVPVLGALGVLTPFLALFVGNAFTVLLPSARGAGRKTTAPTPKPSAA